LTYGAEPLYFLDYIATGQLEPQQLVQVVEGIAQGCEQAGCALLGGETAEMPGFYQPNEYDLAGFCVGIVEESQLVDGMRIQLGDVVIGLASSGVHSNGYSLVRKIIEDSGFQWNDCPSLLEGQSLGEVLLRPTQLYVKPVLAARAAGLELHGMAHITGGGLPENLPRCLQADQAIVIDITQWTPPPIFQWLAAVGEVQPTDMFHTFNMGIGFGVIVPRSQTAQAITWFTGHGLQATEMGSVVAGQQNLLGIP
jgi:phosphoribosylformylglycinamidine cyclo-ligase